MIRAAIGGDRYKPNRGAAKRIRLHATLLDLETDQFFHAFCSSQGGNPLGSQLCPHHH